MSRRFNHAKVNMQKRIAYESREGNSSGEAWGIPSDAHGFKWRAVYFKKHKGKTLPEVLTFDPAYVIGWLYMQDVLFKALLSKAPTAYQMAIAHQLQALANRGQRIRPPKRLRKTHAFWAVIDDDGVFESVRIIRKGKAPNDLSAGYKAVKLQELDLSLPYNYANPGLGLKRMSKCFREIFFGTMFPTAEECQDFFFNDDNFNLESCTSHTSLSCGLRDYELLKGRIGVYH